MTMKVKSDPDGDILAKVSAMLLGGLLAASLWFVFRVSDGNLMMIVGGGFIIMAVHGEPRWKDKMKIALLMAFYSGLIQFFMAMLLNDRFLLLGFMFASTFLLLYYWKNRVAASITLAIASIGIVQSTGFQPGMTRFINQMLSGGCALAGMAVVEYLLTSWRIRLIMQQYALVLNEQLTQLSSPTPSVAPEVLKIRIFSYGRKANQLLAGQRFLWECHNKKAEKARIPLEHLHVISRALVLLENTDPADRARHADAIRQLEKELLSMAENLKYGVSPETITAPPDDSAVSSRAGRAVAIIAGELAAMRKTPAKAV